MPKPWGLSGCDSSMNMTNCDDLFAKIESAVLAAVQDGDIDAALETIGDALLIADPRIERLAAGLTTEEIEQTLLDFARRAGTGADGEPGNTPSRMLLTFVCLAELKKRAAADGMLVIDWAGMLRRRRLTDESH